MNIQLIVSDTCAPCRQAELVWREVAAQHRLEFAVVDIASSEGQALAERLSLKTIPAIVLDGALVAIGVQTREDAHKLVADAARR